ncbi:MAG: DUF481 domain-containing protein [Candidatus Aminicenantes bacterium]|nr:DUF481 domain-containing protein [Candidatus Aminicenantes bacterium]
MSGRKCLVVIILLILAWGPSAAAEEPEETPRWKGDLSLGLSLARGNSRSSSFSFTVSADGPVNESKTLLWANKLVYLFGEVGGETSAESLLAVTRLDWQHGGRFFTYFELQGMRDRFKNLDSRVLPAAGAGYKVIARKTVTLVVDAGLSRVFTKYHDPNSTENYTSLKAGEQFVWKISETSEFNERMDLVPDISDFARYFVRWEANLITALAKSWSVKLTLIDSYDHKPVGLGIKKNDVVFIAALSRKF